MTCERHFETRRKAFKLDCVLKQIYCNVCNFVHNRDENKHIVATNYRFYLDVGLQKPMKGECSMPTSLSINFSSYSFFSSTLTFFVFHFSLISIKREIEAYAITVLSLRLCPQLITFEETIRSSYNSAQRSCH